MQCYVLSCDDQNHFEYASKCNTDMHDMFYILSHCKHICVSIITCICELDKGGGGEGQLALHILGYAFLFLEH